MKPTRNKTLRGIFALILPAIFCLYMGGVTLFPHVHIIDGVVVCHSHPYSGTNDNPGHSHSLAQLDTIAQLSMVVLVLVTLLTLSGVFRRQVRCNPDSASLIPVDRDSAAPCLRGPPAR